MAKRSKRVIPALFAGTFVLLATGWACAGDLIVTLRDGDGRPVVGAVVTAAPESSRQAGPTAPATPYRIDQKDTAYHPAVSIVPAGGSVEFVNSDSWGHHVYSFSSAKKFDITVPSRTTSRTVAFDKAGIVVIGCNIHDRMLAHIYVNGEGQPAKTDKQGIARFLGLPAGDYRLSAWHPGLRSKRKRPKANVTIDNSVEKQAELTMALKRQGKKKSRTKYR